MVKNQPILEVLKELEDLSHIDVKDPDDDTFEKVKISAFDEDIDEVKSFGNLRKTVGNDGVYDRKYEGEKASRKNVIEWSDDEMSDIGTEVSESEGEKDISEDDEIPIDDVDHEEADSESENGDFEDFSDSGDEHDTTTDNTVIIDPTSIPSDLKGDVESLENDFGYGVDNFTALPMDENVSKGEATRAQLDILDKLLESRIRLQKVLHLCNQLPQHDVMNAFVEQASPQVKETYEGSKKLFKEMLDKLLKLQELLCETNDETSSILTPSKPKDDSDEEIPSDTEDEGEDDEKEAVPCEGNQKVDLDLPSKRKHTLTVDDYEEEIIKRRKVLRSFQETTINKWHERTRLSSSNIRNKNFSSFDKSVTQQIKQVLLDKDRLIKRTQLCRVPRKILGKLDDNAKSDETDLHLQDYDENIFDDGDFYHEMLKELIERKSTVNSDDPIATGRRWLELQKLRSKIKRKVDTRASKGRKVRYDIHSKLVSFMAPQNSGSMSNQARNELFASLFGQVTSIPIR